MPDRPARVPDHRATGVIRHPHRLDCRHQRGPGARCSASNPVALPSEQTDAVG